MKRLKQKSFHFSPRQLHDVQKFNCSIMGFLKTTATTLFFASLIVFAGCSVTGLEDDWDVDSPGSTDYDTDDYEWGTTPDSDSYPELPTAPSTDTGIDHGWDTGIGWNTDSDWDTETGWDTDSEWDTTPWDTDSDTGYDYTYPDPPFNCFCQCFPAGYQQPMIIYHGYDTSGPEPVSGSTMGNDRLIP